MSWQDDQIVGSNAPVPSLPVPPQTGNGVWSNDPIVPSNTPTPVSGLSNWNAPNGKPFPDTIAGLSGNPAAIVSSGVKGLARLGDMITGPSWDLSSRSPVTDVANNSGYINNPKWTPSGDYKHATTVTAGAAEGAGASLPFGGLGMLSGAVSGGVGAAAKDANLPVGAQNALSIGSGLVTGGIGGIGSKLSSMADTNTPLMQSYIDAGVKPRMVTDLTDSPTLSWLQNNILSHVPFSSNTLAGSAKKSVGDLSNAVENTASDLAPSMNQEQLGNSLQSSAKDWVDRFKAANEQRYNDLATYFNGGTDPVQLDNTIAKLNELNATMKDAPNTAGLLTSPFYSNLQSSLGKDMSNGSLSYNTVKSLRSDIGSRIASPGAYQDISGSQLSGLYGAISDDLNAAAAAKGPVVADAFNNANKAVQAGHQTLDSTINPILNANTPEQAAGWALGGIGKGGSRINPIVNEMPEASGPLGAYVMRGLGTNKDGSFSPSRYATSWNGLSDGAKSTLYNNSQKMDDLNNIAQSMRGSTEKLASKDVKTSLGEVAGGMGLGHLLTGGGLSLPTVGGLAVGAGLIGTPYVASKALTSPWMSRFASATNNAPLSPFIGGGILGSNANTGGVYLDTDHK